LISTHHNPTTNNLYIIYKFNDLKLLFIGYLQVDGYADDIDPSSHTSSALQTRTMGGCKCGRWDTVLEQNNHFVITQ
jgi:hypothetical protein